MSRVELQPPGVEKGAVTRASQASHLDRQLLPCRMRSIMYCTAPVRHSSSRSRAMLPSAAIPLPANSCVLCLGRSENRSTG